MATFEKKKKWWRWAGSLEEVALAVEAVGNHLSQDGTPPNVFGSVTLRGGEKIRLDDIGDMTDLRARRPHEVQGLWLHVGEMMSAPGTTLSFRTAAHRGVELETRMPREGDLLETERAVQRVLDRGKRSPSVPYLHLIPLALWWMAFVQVVTNALANDRQLATPTWLVLLGSFIAAVLLWWLLPPCEFLEPGGKTRWQRFWVLLAFLVGLVAGLTAIADSFG